MAASMPFTSTLTGSSLESSSTYDGFEAEINISLDDQEIKGKGAIVTLRDGQKWLVALPTRVIRGEN